MSRILVTGAAGYIGSAFCKEGLERGFNIIGIDNFSNSSDQSINFLLEKKQHNFTFSEVDLCKDLESLREIFVNNDINYVVHFAGFKSVIESQMHPKMYWDNNLESTKNLTRIMLEYGVKNILFSSSASVYGKSKNQPVSEACKLKPMSVYGATKEANEKFLEDLSTKGNLKTISLRYFNPVGNIQMMPVNSPRQDSKNLMDNIIDVCIGETKELNIFGDDYKTSDGTAERDFIHIQDLIDAHFESLKYFEQLNGYEVFNIGTGNSVSVKNIIKTFKEVNSIEFVVQISDRREGDVPICYADNSKAKNILKWEAKKDLREMCLDAWRPYKK